MSNSLQPRGLYVAFQAPLSLEYSGQEYWSAIPFSRGSSQPNPGIEPGAPALQADSLPSEPPSGHYINQAHSSGGCQDIVP